MLDKQPYPTYDEQMERLVDRAKVEPEAVYTVACPICEEKISMSDHDYTVYSAPGDAYEGLVEHLDGAHWNQTAPGVGEFR